MRKTLEPGEDDERVVDEYIEENIDTELRQSEEFHQIVDLLTDEIEKRFTTLTVGTLRRNRQGWPISWFLNSDDRGVVHQDGCALLQQLRTSVRANSSPLW